ncbi:MAG: hypothetical protein NC179_05940, partial [[Eubacterium] siraeum]|nr:hypothetical protein [[Eubacterium] siraeum]
MAENKIRKGFFAKILLVFAFIFFGVVFSLGLNMSAQYAEAATTPASSGYVSIGELLVDGYETQTLKFNGDNVKALYKQLTGLAEPTYNDVKTLAATASDTVLVNSTTFRNKNKTINKSTSGNDISVQFAGIEWTAVQLTMDNSGNNVVLDLFMKDATTDTYKFNDFTSDSYGTYPSNMYGTSKIRAVTLNNGGQYAVSTSSLTTGVATKSSSNMFAKFTMSASELNTSVQQFLIAPKNTYQYNNMINSITNTNTFGDYKTWKEAANETVSSPPKNYTHTDTVLANYITGKESYYSAWGDDYVWLPAYGQVGRVDLGGGTSTIASVLQGRWDLSKTQFNTKNSYYVRFAHTSTDGPSGIRYLNQSGISGAYASVDGGGKSGWTCKTNEARGIRVGIHLNLTAVESGGMVYSLDEPSSVSADYTGNALKIDLNSLTTMPTWYNADRMELTYATSEMINRGEYDVTVSIKQDGYVFKGTTKAGETKTTRKIKFTINPRILSSATVSVVDNKAQINLPTGSILDRDKDSTVYAPQWSFTYLNTTTNVSYNSFPNQYGTYKITPVISNSTTCNYALPSPPPTTTYTLKMTVKYDPDVDELVWLANGNDIVGNKLTYDPNGYTISVGEYFKGGASLQDKGVKVSLSITSVKNVTTYNIVATITNINDEYETKSYTKNYSLNVEKAKYDLSGAKWNYVYDKYVYDGNLKTVAIEGLPSGLSIGNNDYVGDSSARNVSATDYHVSISGLTNADTANYITPISSDPTTYDGTFAWELDWNIKPKQISTATWVSNNYPFESAANGDIYKISGYDNVLEYSYEVFKDGGWSAVSLANITVEQGKEVNYRVTASIVNNNPNYTLSNDKNPYTFKLGVNKEAVTVTVTGSGQSFDNTPKAADFTFTCNDLEIGKSDFAITYLDSEGVPLSDGAPTHAGNYKVQITLKSNRTDTHYITNPDPVEFTVSKATVDLSNIKWNYDASNPFQYQREGGAVKAHKVELVGWDETNALHTYLKNHIAYDGEYEEGEVKSKYTATFDFDGIDLNDFDGLMLPASIADKSLNWKIVKRKIQKPAYSGENLVFSNEDIDLLKLFGISDDWAEYFTIDATYNGEPMSGYIAKDAGTYAFECKLLVAELGDNVAWDDNSISAAKPSVKVDPRVVNLSGWSDDAIPSPVFDDPDDEEFIESIFTDMSGNPVTQSQVASTPNTTFKVALQSKFGDNVVVQTEGDIDDFAEFSTPADASNPPTQVAKPTLQKNTLQYTGSPLTFKLNNFNDDYMLSSLTVTANGEITVTDIGEYQITIRFVDGANYCWNDGTRDPFTLTFSVTEQAETPPPADDGSSFLDKIKELIDSGFPLWQVATMAAAGLLAIIFAIKTGQYASRAKKAKGETKKISARTYASLLPIFATETVLAGLSNKIWSIMAFAFVGLALLMFVVALITRHSWKKAEAAKEAAIEDSEQRKYNSQNANQLALQERISQMSAPSADNSSIIEEMRREMERQRREDEERRREDEERHRQEMDAMKLMLANFMGRQQGEDGYAYASVDDTDLLVQKVIAGLLPAVQQMI